MGFIICSIGVILPWRLRIIYAEILGWIAQLIYLIYFSIFKFIIKNLSRTAKGVRSK